MKSMTRAAAALLVVALICLLTACSGDKPAPLKYTLTQSGLEIDSLTAIVGERTYEGVNAGAVANGTAYKYSGLTDPLSDISAYADYLRSVGFIDCYAAYDAQLCMVKRSGDGGALLTIRTTGSGIELRLSQQDSIELFYGNTRYVSGSALAILPDSELVVFEYPVLGDALPDAAAINQYILDGVNSMMQHARDMAAGAQYKLMGSFTIDSALASCSSFRLTGVLTIGDQVKTLTSTITLSDLTGTPAAEYSDISVHDGAPEADGAVG